MAGVDIRFSNMAAAIRCILVVRFMLVANLDFSGGDDRLVWSAGTIAGNVDFGGHDTDSGDGDRVVLEFERGESVLRLFDATALDKVTSL